MGYGGLKRPNMHVDARNGVSDHKPMKRRFTRLYYEIDILKQFCGLESPPRYFERLPLIDITYHMFMAKKKKKFL